MTIAEILRAMLDSLDDIESQDQSSDSPDHQEKMMSPNQQKIELLKKGVGVDSEYDEEPTGCGCNDDYSEELDELKFKAGIAPVVVHIATDDDPLE